jgi:Raf kinase inhibitor-like YbhB/YbcL family protein
MPQIVRKKNCRHPPDANLTGDAIACIECTGYSRKDVAHGRLSYEIAVHIDTAILSEACYGTGNAALTTEPVRRTKMSFALTSTAFSNGGKIPSKYTCEGDDLSPPLSWTDVPEGTKSLALIVDDPDAPDPARPQRVYVHWVVYNISPNAAGFGERASPNAMPSGAVTGVNDFNTSEWGGPCPPIGRHRYFFKLYALDTMLHGLSRATKKDLESAMHGHILAQAELMGTYQKGD